MQCFDFPNDFRIPDYPRNFTDDAWCEFIIVEVVRYDDWGSCLLRADVGRPIKHQRLSDFFMPPSIVGVWLFSIPREVTDIWTWLC